LVGFPLTNHVESEQGYVYVEVFVVEEAVGDVAEVGGVGFFFLGVDFEDGEFLVSVDLIAGWATLFASFRVHL